MNDKEYLKYAKKFIKINISSLNDQNLAILTFKNQISHFDELNHLINDTFLEVNFNDIEQILNNNQISKEDFKKNVATFEKILVEYKNITETNANEIINKIKELSGLKGKALFMPIRLITIGKEHGPEMNKILPVIGYKKIIDNLKKIKLKY
ncbi:MAG: hypothetical protein LBT02_03985 [Rickettsiales bacterium]|jgi:nondiscriminating glutamyl-tRNA synthetase|nr:hypothetical protein [Rickettsiales bacterium]